MADILTLPPIHPRRSARDPSVQHDKNTRSQHKRRAREDALVVNEVQMDADPSSVDANPVAEDVIPKETMSDNISVEALLGACWQAVDEQQAVNNIALEEYAQFETVNIAFIVNGHGEVEALRREDIQVFMDPNKLMTDPAVKSVIW